MELLKLDNLNTIHGLKAVTENVRQLSKRIDSNTQRPQIQLEKRHSKKIEQLKAGIEILKREQELRENKPKRSPKIGSIREFCPKTESDYISSGSGKKLNGKEFGHIKPIHVREFRLDSSLSQVIRPLDLLKDTAVKAQWDSDHSSIKTPNKKETDPHFKIPYFKNFLEDDSIEHKGAKTPVKSKTMANVKDFDDFKFLLKDLKMTLNMSEFSEFQDDLGEQMAELEKTLIDYSDLDKRIVSLIESSKNRQKFNSSFCDGDKGFSLDLKRCQSVKFKDESSNRNIRELEMLKSSSNINNYHTKIKDLKNNPFDFESFIFKIKKEMEARRKKFEEIQEFLI